MANIERPTTATEALRNFKFALDNDLFLDGDFYKDESLEKFFDAKKIKWDEIGPMRRVGSISSPHLDLFVVHGKLDAQGHEIGRDRTQGSGTANASLTANSVVEVFGKPDRVTNPYAAEDAKHPSALLPTTHDLGNLAIEYAFNHLRATASLYCILNGDGTIKGCNFANTEK